MSCHEHLLEPIAHALYSTMEIDCNGRTVFFVDTMYPSSSHKTNMRTSAHLSYPKTFDLTRIVGYPTRDSLHGAKAEVLQWVRENCTVELYIGCKPYIQLPAFAVIHGTLPIEIEKTSEFLKDCNDRARNYNPDIVNLHRDSIDLMVYPNKKKDGIPLHIPSQQQFTVELSNEKDKRFYKATSVIHPDHRPSVTMFLIGTLNREIA